MKSPPKGTTAKQIRYELLQALQLAKTLIRTWHGMGLGAHEAQAWALYQASPEMQRINAAIARGLGGESRSADPQVKPAAKAKEDGHVA